MHKHRAGGCSSPTYNTWNGMNQRCCNPNNKDYPRYGGRGIGVHPDWLDDFRNFLADMGERPEDMTLDRIDNDGNYEPNNCKWATRKEQSRKRGNNRLIAFNGTIRCISEWAEIIGISRALLRWRLERGWSIKRALTGKQG